MTFKEFVEMCNKFLEERSEVADYKAICIYDCHYKIEITNEPIVYDYNEAYDFAFVKESELNEYPERNKGEKVVSIVDAS